MKSEFWHDRWLNSQIGFHQSEVNSYLQEHWSEHFQDRGTVFVPLCGKSRDMVWLCDQGHTVIGSELSAIAPATSSMKMGWWLTSKSASVINTGMMMTSPYWWEISLT